MKKRKGLVGITFLAAALAVGIFFLLGNRRSSDLSRYGTLVKNCEEQKKSQRVSYAA